MDEPASITTTPQGSASDNTGPFSRVPIEVTISIGRARPLVCDLLQLKQNSVLALEQHVDDPVELYVGPRLVARGELEELDGEQKGQLAVRLTEVVDLKNGI